MGIVLYVLIKLIVGVGLLVGGLIIADKLGKL